MMYNDISLHINLNKFEKLNNDLKQYHFIIIGEYNEHDFMKVRKKIDQIQRELK